VREVLQNGGGRGRVRGERAAEGRAQGGGIDGTGDRPAGQAFAVIGRQLCGAGEQGTQCGHGPTPSPQ
jgi:hypothetical protein